MKLIVSQAAAADLARLHAFLSDKSPTAAERAVAVLVAAIRSLDTFPGRGRLSSESNMRELIVPFGRSSYVVRYVHSAHADEIVVLRIWQGARGEKRTRGAWPSSSAGTTPLPGKS